MKAFIILLLIACSFTAKGISLQCRYINDIQNKFLENHINFSSVNTTLQTRAIEQFVKSLDPQKIYFLKGDVQKIKRKTRKLFSDLEKRNCKALYDIYNIFKKRVEERVTFATNHLQNNFKLIKSSVYNVDVDNLPYPRTQKAARKRMKNYLQYQAANIFITEENIGKVVQHLTQTLNAKKTRVVSWKPQLTPREWGHCKRIQKEKNFKTCKPSKWFARYLDAFAQSLDSHSSYMDNDAIEEFKIHMELSLEGIGATLTSRFGYTIVERLTPGGSAFRSGNIKAKDKILSVGQKKKNMVNIFGVELQDVVSMIRGPKGTPVYLKLMRETEKGKKQFLNVRLIRDVINIQEEAASIFFIKRKNNRQFKNIAILTIPSFYGSGRFGMRSVSRDVKKLLKLPQTKKADAIVLDLSNNRGGSLDEAVTLSGFFFAKGNVVKQAEKKASRPNLLSDRDSSVLYNGPLVVLVNRLSASASEIVSGTLKNYERAVIVGGDRTFGKGSVQSVDYLPHKLGAIKTTVGLYFIPNGHSTQNDGVSSDISFPSVLNVEEFGEKSLDYALPKQIIAPFKSPPKELFSSNPEENWKPVTSGTITELKKLSLKRIEKNEKFKKIKQKLSRFQKRVKEKKPISVQEILKDDKKDKEEELTASEDFPDLHHLDEKKKKKKYLERADVEEAINIAIDLSLIHNKTKAAQSQSPHTI
ncbi:MAG: carboxy terminal-processing peptidase [Bdellovibrionales bacterium]|nr:carboxy terminal-processing peptidase [Bdellovibrionales bacterium]